MDVEVAASRCRGRGRLLLYSASCDSYVKIGLTGPIEELFSMCRGGDGFELFPGCQLVGIDLFSPGERHFAQEEAEGRVGVVDQPENGAGGCFRYAPDV